MEKCSKPGCGAQRIIGRPCTDWDCPQQTVEASEYAAVKDLLNEEFRESARRAEKLLALRDDAELSFHRIRECMANGWLKEAFEIADREAQRYRKPLNEMGLDRASTLPADS